MVAVRPACAPSRNCGRCCAAAGPTASCRTPSSGRPAGWRRAPLYATARFRGDTRTETIDPPLLAVRLGARRGRRSTRASLEGLARWRPTCTGWSPSATPTATACSRSCSRTSPGSTTRRSTTPSTVRSHTTCPATRAGRAVPAHALERHAIAARTDLHVEDVLVNVAYALSLRALARLTGDAHWSADAPRAPRRRCWSGAWTRGRGLFFDLAGRGERPVEISTWSSLAPLALAGHPTRSAAARRGAPPAPAPLPRPVGIPSVSMEEPSFKPGFDRYRTWRGAAWVNTAWLLVGDARARLRRRGRPRSRRASADARTQRLPRVLRPAQRRRPRRARLRLVDADGRPPAGFSTPRGGSAKA